MHVCLCVNVFVCLTSLPVRDFCNGWCFRNTVFFLEELESDGKNTRKILHCHHLTLIKTSSPRFLIANYLFIHKVLLLFEKMVKVEQGGRGYCLLKVSLTIRVISSDYRKITVSVQKK